MLVVLLLCTQVIVPSSSDATGHTVQKYKFHSTQNGMPQMNSISYMKPQKQKYHNNLIFTEAQNIVSFFRAVLADFIQVAKHKLLVVII